LTASCEVIAERLTPSVLLDHLAVVANKVRLSLSYDSAYLKWLFAELSAVRTRGELVGSLIRDPRRRRVLGWYVYYLLPGGVSQVVQVAAAERDVGPVLDHLFHHASQGGSSIVRGRVEPALLEPLTRRRTRLRYTGMALMYSHQQSILGAIATGDCLSRMDGEWWMGHHLLDF
jgi:hypothetical protein